LTKANISVVIFASVRLFIVVLTGVVLMDGL